MAKLVWCVKLVAELRPGVTSEVEVARVEREAEAASLADLGLRLDEAKRLLAALQAEVVPAQMAALGERGRACEACGRRLASKGHYRARFRSLFGDVPVPVRRLLTCPCRGSGGPQSFAALALGNGAAVAPELAYVTARHAALVPFGQVAALLSELLPLGGAQHASTVRNRTHKVGREVVQAHTAEACEAAERSVAHAAGPVVVGLDGGYVRSRHRAEGRRFEVVAGKVTRPGGGQHRFAFVRDGQVPAAEALRRELAAVGVGAETPATVLCDGDAGLWRLQREVLPGATVVLDWWRVAVRFEHALQAARGLGKGTAGASPADALVRGLERAKWRLRHGRWPGCRRGLAALCRWMRRRPLRDVAGIGRLQQDAADLLGYIERNEAALVHYAARRRRGEPIATSFVESAVNEVVAKRMNKRQQMRWSKQTVQPFLDVRIAVLNGTLEHSFRQRYLGFRPANDDRALPAAA